jgi:hypothetical protein
MIKHCMSSTITPALTLLVLLISTIPGCAQTYATRITADELNAMLGDRQAVIVDVRETRDWENSDQKIEGAIRLDPGNLDPANLPLAKNAKLVLY